MKMAVLLLSVVAMGCCRKDVMDDRGTGDPTILRIAEVNYGGSGVETRAVAGGGGVTTFTDGDALGLFLRGEGYTDIDNRRVEYEYKDELWKRWVISGEEIRLSATPATVTGYFPYSDGQDLRMSAMPLAPGPYDVNRNDFVWQKDVVSTARPQAMFLGMQHALTRVRLVLNNTDNSQAKRIVQLSIADAGDVPRNERVIYTDGTIDLTGDEPAATGGTKGSVSDTDERTLGIDPVVYDLLLIPVEKIEPGKIILYVLVDRQILSAVFPTDLVTTWQAGTAYTYTVTVQEKTLDVYYGGSEVIPWEDNGWGVDIGDRKPQDTEADGTVLPWDENTWETEVGQ